MRIVIYIGIILLLLLPSTSAQNNQSQRGVVVQFDYTGFCNYDGSAPMKKEIYTFDSDQDAEMVIDRIIKPTGLKRNFIIKAATVNNAEASFDDDGNRAVFYNREFMRDARRQTGTEWAAVSIIAHEIGHHLQGHTLKILNVLNQYEELELLERAKTLEKEKARPSPDVIAELDSKISQTRAEIQQYLKNRRKEEIEADNFSGFNLCKQGASLEQATIAMKKMVIDEGSDTHPPKRDRLIAIESGWRSAGCSISSEPIAVNPVVPPSPVTKPEAPPPPVKKEPSKVYDYRVFHAHGYVGSPDTAWGDGTLTVDPNTQEVKYFEISGDRDPTHKFVFPCQSLTDELKLEYMITVNGFRRIQLAYLHIRIGKKNYNFLGIGEDGRAYDQIADRILRTIVTVCNL